jgi:hypothetical protein
MRLKTIGHSRRGHSCKPNPYSSWLSSIKALKLVKAVAGLEKVIEHGVWYPNYDPPGTQVSNDTLAKVSFVYSTLSFKT